MNIEIVTNFEVWILGFLHSRSIGQPMIAHLNATSWLR